VTLVGVINADTTLKIPDFRAAERTYELLEQVAGRAGRGDRPGTVVVQTYWATHPAIVAVASHDMSRYLETELAEREEWRYPPFTRLANVCVWGKDPGVVSRTCKSIADLVRTRISSLPGWEVVGPSACVKERIKDRTRWHVLVKAPPDACMGPVLSDCVREANVPRGMSVAIDVDARDLM
jgi:primosomal protein N' (replication factor Y)